MHVPLTDFGQSVALKEEQPPGPSQPHSPSLSQLHLPWEATRTGEGPLLCANAGDTDLTGRQCEKESDCISLMTHAHGRRGVSLVTALLHRPRARGEMPPSYCNCCISSSSQSSLLWLQPCFLGEDRWAHLHSSVQLLCVKRQRCLETLW